MQRLVHAFFYLRQFRLFAVSLLVSASIAIKPTRAETPDELFQSAQLQYQDGDINSAITSLQKALTGKKNFVDALTLLGSCYVEIGQFSKAVDPYHRASQLAPNDYTILLGYQGALEGAGVKDPQVPVFRSLFKKTPNDLVMGIKFMTLLEELGTQKYPGEYAELLEVMRKDANADQTYSVKLANHYLGYKKFDRAIPVFKELIQRDPESVSNWKGLAEAQLALSQNSESKESYKKAILYSNNADERAQLEKSMNSAGSNTAVAVIEPKPADVQVVNQAQIEADKKAKNDADKLAKEDATRIAKEESSQKAKTAAEAKALAEAEKKAKLESERLSKEEAARIAKEESAQKAKTAAEAKAVADAEKKAKLEADRLAKVESTRVAKEMSEAKTKAKSDSIAQASVERKAKLEATRLAKEEVARIAKEESAQKAKTAAEAKAVADAEKKAKLEADRLAKVESIRVAKEMSEAKTKAKSDSIAQASVERKAKLETARLVKEEAARIAKEEAAQKAKSVAEAKAVADAEKKAKLEAERLSKEEAARFAKEEAEQKAKTAAEAKAVADAEKKAKLEAARLAKEEAARVNKEIAEAKSKAKSDSIAQALVFKREKAKADSITKAQIETERKARLEEERKAKVETDRIAKEEAAQRAKTIAEAKALAEAEKKVLVEAERKAKEEAARLAKEEADIKAKAKAEAIAKALEEKREKEKQDSIVKAETIKLAREEATRKAKIRADSLVQAEAEKRVRLEAERKAKEEAAKIARELAEQKAKERADSSARVDAEKKVRDAAELDFQQGVDAILSQKSGKLDTAALALKIQDRIAASKLPSPRFIEALGILNYHQWNFTLAAEQFRKLKVLSQLTNRLMALSLYEQKEYGNAVKYFSKVVDIHSNKSDWGKYIQALNDAGQKPKAAAEYEIFLAQNPSSEEALNYLVDFYRQPLQKEKLLPKLESLLNKTPKDAALLTEIIGLLPMTSPKALEYRQKLLTQSPDDNRIKLELARMQEARGNRNEAVLLYLTVAGDHTSDKAFNLKLGEMLLAENRTVDAIKYLEIAQNLEPNNKVLLLKLAGIYDESKMTDKARETYLKAWELDTKDKVVQSKTLAAFKSASKEQRREFLTRVATSDPTAHAVQFEMAKLSNESGDKEIAYSYLMKALKLQPQNVEYQSLLPAVVTSDAQVTENLPLLEKLIQMPGSKPEMELMVARGLALRQNPVAGRYFASVYTKAPNLLEGSKEAILALRASKNYPITAALASKYLSANPEDKDVRGALVEALTATGKGGEDLRKALKGLVQSDPIGGAKYLLRLAELDLQAHDSSEALEHAKAYAEKNPKDIAGWRFIYTLVRGKDNQAELQAKAMEQLWAVDVTSRSRYDRELSELYFKRGDFEDAQKTLLRATNSSPADGSLWYRLGEVELKLRKETAAASRFAKAYQMQPSNSIFARAYGQTLNTNPELKGSLALWRSLSLQSPSSEERLKFAKALFLNDDFAGSARQWDDLIKADENLARTESMVGESYLKSGQMVKARGIMEDRLEKDPTNLSILESIATLYKQANDMPGYLKTLERIVQVDAKHKGYLLVLALEKEKSKDFKGAMELYEQWIGKTPGDVSAVRSLLKLAEQTNDTTRLMDALTRLNREKNAGNQYKFRMAEIDYARGGSIVGVEALAKGHPEWQRGKEILVRTYLKQNQKAKLAPYLPFLLVASGSDKSLLEPLGDVYAMEKKNLQANSAYWNWLQNTPKTRSVYDKVYGFAKTTKSLNLKEILHLGYQNFSEDEAIAREYAASLGNTQQALTIYQAVISKDDGVATLEKGVALAIALRQFTLASQWLDKWAAQSSKDVKVWESVYAVSQQTGNRQRQLEALEKIVALQPNHKDGLLKMATVYEEQGKTSQATDAYKKIIAMDPKNKEVLRKLKSMLKGQSHQEDLKQVLLQVEAADPTAHEAQFELSKIYLIENEKLKAYEYLAKALKLQPNNTEYQAQLPAVVTSDEQALPYLAVLERQVQIPGAKVELEYLVARGLLSKKNFTAASRLLYSVFSKSPRLLEGNRDAILALHSSKQFTASGPLATKFLSQSPTDKEIRTIQVEAYTASGKSGPELREALKGLIDNNPEAGAKYLLRLADLDLQARDSASALLHAKGYATRNPKSLEIWRMVYGLSKGKNSEEAAYKQALEQLSLLDVAGRSRYDRELADIQFKSGNFEDAQKILLRAVNTSPREANLWFKLGQAELKMRKEVQATQRFAKAYDIEPSNMEYARAYSASITTPEAIKSSLPLWKLLATKGPTVDERRKLAHSLFLNGDYAGSAREWEWLMQGDPTVGQTEPMVSQAYLRSGQFSKARGIVQERLKTEPNNLELLEGMVNISRQEGKPEAIIKSLESLVQVNPKYKNYQLLLAQEKEKAKDLKGALEQYDQLIARTGGDPASLRVMHRLAETLKDTARLVEALVRINREKGLDLRFEFQAAAVDYARGGSIIPIEKLVKKYPAFRDGRVILVKEYLKKRDAVKLASKMDIVDQLMRDDRAWSDAAGDVYAKLKKSDKANEAYFAAFLIDKKNKNLFDKIYEYGKQTGSPYRLGLLKQGYETFTEDADIKFEYAESQGKTQRALDLYSEILSRNRNHLPSVRNSAEVLMVLGKSEQAKEMVSRWAELEPKNIRPWTLMAETYLRTRNESKLAEALGMVSQLSPKDGKAANAAAQAYIKVDDKSKALEYLTTAIALEPTNAEYHREFGLMQLAASQPAKAKASLLIAEKKLPRDEKVNKGLYEVSMNENDKKGARERMKILYIIKPNNKSYALSLGKLENDLNNPSEVARILSRPELRDTLDASVSFMLLDAYFKTNQRDKAGLLGPQLLQKYPSEAKKSLPLGVLFFEQGNKAKAKEILEAYTNDKASEEGFYYLGKLRYQEKDWRGAATSLERAMKYKPDALSMLGEAYVMSGDAAHAIIVYEDFYTKGKDRKSLEELYKLYKKTRDNAGIAKTLERLLAIDGKNLDYRSELASFYLTSGNAKKSEEQFEQILKTNPAHPLSNYYYGMILATRKDWVRAARMLEIGTGRFPDSGFAWQFLGDANRALKRPMPALQAYKRAAKLQPQNTAIAIARMELTRDLNLTSELPDAYDAVLKLDPDNLIANSALAGVRFQERKYSEAANLYARVVDKHTEDKQAWVNYGYSLLELKRISEAKKALQRALDLGVKDQRMMTSLARIYKEEGNVEKAEQLLNDLIKKDAKNHWALFGLGQIALERNQPGVAEGYFRKAYQASMGSGEYAEALGKILASKDECGQAIPVFESARSTLSNKGKMLFSDCLLKEGKDEAAMGLLKSVFDQDPSPEVLSRLADLNLSRGNIKEALRILASASSQSDSNIEFSLAKVQLASNQPGKARILLNSLVDENKHNANYLYQRGVSWFQDRDWRQAQKDFDQALKYNDDLLDAAYYSGICLLKLGKAMDAQNFFKELSQSRNVRWQAKGFHGMAMAFDMDHKLEAAENYLLKSVAAKETPEALAMLGRVYLRQRKPPLAEKQARRALELKPDDAAGVAVLSEVLMAQGRKDEALQMTSKSLQENPNSCELNLGAAKIHFLAGNYESSRQSGMKAVDNCPDDPGGYFFVALVASKKYKKDEAKLYFKDFVKHGGDAKLVPQAYR